MAKPPIDWESVERDYRAGLLSVSEIGRQQGVSHTAINKRSKRDGWTRNLSAQVREEVSARLVSAEVSGPHTREIVDAAAAQVVEVVRSHRRDVSRGRGLVAKLLEELGEATDEREAIEDAIEVETAGDKTGNRRAVMLRAVALPSRAGVIKELSAAMKNLVALERQAFNIEGPTEDEPASKADVVAAVTRLNQGQRDQLRGIAAALAGGPGDAPAGA